MSKKERERLEVSEIRHGRLAMVGLAGMIAAALVTGAGPINNLLRHIADPFNTTIVQHWRPAAEKEPTSDRLERRAVRQMHAT